MSVVARWNMLWLVALVLGLAVGAAEPTQAADVADRIDALKQQTQEREAERKRLEAEHAKELAALREQREALAAKLLAADRRRVQLSNREADLEAQARRLEARVKKENAALRSVISAVRSAGEQLAINLSEMPGYLAMEAALEQPLATLQQRRAPDRAVTIDEVDVAAAGKVIALYGRVLADVDRVHVEPRTVWTAREKEEKVQLLMIGHIGFAYRTTEDGRVGLALASPSDASGYRWTEELGRADRSAISDAIDAVGGGSAMVAVPMDPSGRLRPANLQAPVTFFQRIVEGGLVMIPLLLVALVALALIIERAWQLYGLNSDSEQLAREVVEAAREGDMERALARCRTERGSVAHTLEACLQRHEQGQAAMEDSVQAQLLSELPHLQRFMGGIAILAGVAPLLGLLGTVTGIIQTFGVIRAFGNANPSMMAGGISEALITTAAGLVIAVP
ncbi:MAG: MotA/TolQ/ExbB proton channel family protein, partial [Phycisphaeraceae bacterium]|nr:MotA/TolQ/ExbB proton channel family protein [Phycisphaeraceae bacterium]